MTIDAGVALGTRYPSVGDSWDSDAVILYHLGLGAGFPELNPPELDYLLETSLKVLPTFGVVPALRAIQPVLQGPGLEYEMSRMLHAEHELIVHRQVAAAATVVTTPLVEAIYDRGSAALVVLRADTRASSGPALFTNRFTLFIRGEGGFGGVAPPRVSYIEPVGPPSLEVEQTVLPQQAAIYRLSGDHNPLHIDPGAARTAGFDRPVLHGLCTYGMACKAVVDRLLGGDPCLVRRWTVRFSKPVFAEQTLVHKMWVQERRVLVTTIVKQTGEVALSRGCVELRGAG